MICFITYSLPQKTYFQSVESLNNFSQIISEYQLNTKEEEVSFTLKRVHLLFQVSDLICYSAVSYLTNSDNPLFLPTPTAVSFLFHKVVMVCVAFFSILKFGIG